MILFCVLRAQEISQLCVCALFYIYVYIFTVIILYMRFTELDYPIRLINLIFHSSLPPTTTNHYLAVYFLVS